MSSSVSEDVLVALICYSLFLLLSTGARLLELINWLFFVTSERALSVMSETTYINQDCAFDMLAALNVKFVLLFLAAVCIGPLFHDSNLTPLVS